MSISDNLIFDSIPFNLLVSGMSQLLFDFPEWSETLLVTKPVTIGSFELKAGMKLKLLKIEVTHRYVVAMYRIPNSNKSIKFNLSNAQALDFVLPL